MNIIIVISRPEMGGAQRVSINLADWINAKTEHKASIVALSHLDKGAYNMSLRDYHYLKSINKVCELRALLKDLQADIVLTMGVPLCIYTVPATIGLPLKHVVSERNDPAHFAGKRSTAIISRELIKLADAYVFQTKEAQAFYGGRIARNSVIIPNPLFNIQSMPLSIYNGEREKTIVTVGRLNPQKNHKLLIDAFSVIHKQYPEYSLKIWGEGSERNSLEEFVKEKGLEKHVFLPGVSNKVFKEIFRCSMFVLSSDFEGMPNALMEAMALGLPCISTDCPCGGPSFLINNEENGLLVDVGNKQQIVDAIIKLIEHPSLASKIGHNAFAIRTQLSEQVVNKRWLEYFANVIKL